MDDFVVDGNGADSVIFLLSGVVGGGMVSVLVVYYYFFSDVVRDVTGAGCWFVAT